MRLKRLIVHGFKSFADRTVFDFEGHGMTAIVGPNGCGKSNVLEAVKWVLGEQRPTSLRSREMTDVIFNGTVRRPPMGLCQGTLIFDNGEGILPIDASEVEVIRRVSRAGDTEYLVNGRAARLKDVRNLMAGTGLGAGGYGFMAQGKIDSVLASNPVERRKVFEEAAGISRFRGRKHEAELKLRRVQENLTRLDDIVDEITRQIRSLKIHAGKARNHREMTARVRSLQTAWSVQRWRALASEQGDLAERLEQLTNARGAHTEQRESLRERLREVEERAEAARERVGGLRTEMATLDAQVDSSRQKQEFHENYCREVGQRRERKEAEIEGLATSVTEATAELEAVREELTTLEAESTRVREQLETQRTEAKSVRDRAEELERACEAEERRLAKDDRDLGERERVEARTEADISHLDERALTVAERASALAPRRGGLVDRVRERALLLAATRAAHEIRVSKRDERRTAVQSAKAAEEAAVTAQREAERTHDRVRSRRDLLEGVLARGEALDKGTRRLLDAAKKDENLLPGYLGLLAELISVPRDEAVAIENALGPAARALVVGTTAEALRVLEVAADLGVHGVLVLPLDRLPEAPATLEGLAQPSRPEGAKVVAAILRGLEVVDREEFGRRLAGGVVGSATGLLVATDGAAARPDGFLAGPPAKKGGDSGLLALRSEVEELEAALPEHEAAVSAARSTLEAARARRTEAEARLSALEEGLASDNAELRRIESERRRAETELSDLDKELTRLGTEAEGLGSRRAERVAALDIARAEREALSERVARDREALAKERHRLAEFARERERVAEALEEVRVEEAKIAERVRSLAGRRQSLESGVRDMAARLEGDKKDVVELGAALEASERSLTQERTCLAELEERREEVAEALGVEEERTAEVIAEAEELASELEGVEGELSAVTETLGSLRGREGEIRSSVEGLLERSRDELDLDLPAAVRTLEERAALAEEASDGEATEEAVAADEAVAPGAELELITVILPPDFVADPPPTPETLSAKVANADTVEADPWAVVESLLLEIEDWKAVEKEIRALRDRIARLGNVNLAAVEELEEAENRSELLFREKNDLEKARVQLSKILRSIEEESTKLFVKTFDAVKEHFSVIFRRLFGGGKAEIFLENPETPLESGIEIKARPPGKEFRSITLLSGGERTMTAVALLFAIFRANPAPCAFLDEVDAALDEDNIERFCRMVMDFTDRSQFVVVTHSKRTMEAAELLYGVTMPERGVSRRVAVRIDQFDDQGNIRDIDQVNREAQTDEQEEPEEGDASDGPGALIESEEELAIEAPVLAHRAEGPADSEEDGEAEEEEAGA